MSRIQDNRARILPWLFLLAAWGLVVVAMIASNPNYQWSDIHRDSPFGGDFLQEWVGADMLRSSKAASLYDLAEFGAWQHDPARIGFTWDANQYYPAVYPPTYYWLLKPLASVEYYYATMIWLTLLVLCFPLAVYVCERFLSRDVTDYPIVEPELDRSGTVRTTTAPMAWSVGFWVAMLFLPAILSSWIMGQKGTIWLLVMSISWAFWQRKQNVLAGAMMGLLTVKPTLFVCIPIFMLWKRQWGYLCGLVLSTAALWSLAAWCLPPSLWMKYLEFVSTAGNYQMNAGYQVAWSCSLVTLFEFSHMSMFPTLKTFLWLILAGFVLGALREIRQEQLRSPEAIFRLLLATCLLSPHWYYYDLVWLILPLRLMLPTSPKRVILYTIILWLGVFTAQHLSEYAQFPVLTLYAFGILMHSRVLSRRARRSTKRKDELLRRAAEVSAIKMPKPALS